MDAVLVSLVLVPIGAFTISLAVSFGFLTALHTYVTSVSTSPRSTEY